MERTLIITGTGIVIALIGLIWRNLSSQVEKKLDKALHNDLERKVDGKLDTQLYTETMIHIQKAVDGINGTAQTLKVLALDIAKIQETFVTKKDLRIHELECDKSCRGKDGK